jgi:hypothetical protein
MFKNKCFYASYTLKDFNRFSYTFSFADHENYAIDLSSQANWHFNLTYSNLAKR